MKRDIVLPTDHPDLVIHIPSSRWSDPTPRIAIAPKPAIYPLSHTIPKRQLKEIEQSVCFDWDVRIVGGNACASAAYLREQKREVAR